MPRPRLWPAVLVLLLGALWIARIWLSGEAIRQWRMLGTIVTSIVVVILLVAWLAFFSRLPRRARLRGVALALAALALLPALFRIRGVTGDLRPVIEPRWARPAALPEPVPPSPAPEAPSLEAATKAPSAPGTSVVAAPAAAASPTTVRPSVAQDLPGFPQFLGPKRDATLPGPRLARDWAARPPRRLWRQPLGQSWSGFAISGEIAVTQEQRGDEERVVATTPAADGRSGRMPTARATRP